MAESTVPVKRARTSDTDEPASSSSKILVSSNAGDSTVAQSSFPSTNFAMMDVGFGVYVCKETFKFNAAHFVAYEGYRERLHGHNYRVGVRLLGHRMIKSDGYLIDFGCVKDVTRKICKSLNDHFLCPMYSNVLTIAEDDTEQQVSFKCEDGSFFSFPASDVAKLPIVHASSEELAVFLWSEILRLVNSSYLINRGIHTMEVSVAEAPGQEAQFRWQVPTTDDDTNVTLDVRSFIAEGKVLPFPCQPDKAVKTKTAPSSTCCPNCKGSKESFSAQLDQLAQAINERGIGDGKLSRQDLQSMLNL
ncbi:hypothetical protein ACA910_011258 [Epithemia clementina (nom. ined.)]